MTISIEEFKKNISKYLKEAEKEEIIIENKLVIKPLKRKLGLYKAEIPDNFNEEDKTINEMFYENID